MFFSKSFDAHSVVHCVGCYALVPTIMVLMSITVMEAAIAAFILGIVWEAFDEWNHRNDLNIVVFDARGADFRDILTDLAGILLAFTVF